ncbi:MAG: hypothetical protein ACI3X9_02575, partial [Bacteroidaceae bacterium]
MCYVKQAIEVLDESLVWMPWSVEMERMTRCDAKLIIFFGNRCFLRQKNPLCSPFFGYLCAF